MLWSLGGGLTPAHRERLLVAGADVDVLAGLVLREVTDPLPEWWHKHRNALYIAADLNDGRAVPRPLIEGLAGFGYADALVVIASTVENMLKLHVGGDRATVLLGPDSSYTATDVYCGGGSAIILNGDLTATREAILDARNGGSIVAAPGQLWAAGVYLATDDMHRLADAASGARINPYGAHIRLGRHVWLGRDAVVTGHVDIGDGAVVGMRSLVRGQKVPADVAVAGTPARVIREGITWSPDDTP